MKTTQVGKKRETESEKRPKLSLYPLDLPTALGAALKTGRPLRTEGGKSPNRPKKRRGKV